MKRVLRIVRITGGVLFLLATAILLVRLLFLWFTYGFGSFDQFGHYRLFWGGN